MARVLSIRLHDGSSIVMQASWPEEAIAFDGLGKLLCLDITDGESGGNDVEFVPPDAMPENRHVLRDQSLTEIAYALDWSRILIAGWKKTPKRPLAALTGMILQFSLMPFLAFVIGNALRLPREQFIGLVLVGTVAGGTASNVITYLAGGDVALSITMTACSTVAGIVLTPLLSSLYLGQMVHVPAWAMFRSILYVVALPVGLGIVINRLCRRHTEVLNKACPIERFSIIRSFHYH